MKIQYFQHVPFEGLAMIKEWAYLHNHTLSSTRFYEEGYTIPSPDQYDILIVMGGSMSVHDSEEYPWLKPEKEAIKQAIEQEKFVLGICLGAQLIAECLGAKVVPNVQKEIGWFPISFNQSINAHYLLNGLNQNMTVFHWHGERFDIPEGAESIAKSKACENQGFLYKDKVLSLQFHIEMNEQSIEKIIQACGDELIEEQYIQNEQTIREKTAKHQLKESLFKLLDNWVSL